MSRDTGVFFFKFCLFFITLILFLCPQYVKTAMETAMAATAVTVLGAQDATCLEPLVSIFIFYYTNIYF